MRRVNWKQGAALAFSAVFTLLAGMPVSSVPVKVYDSAAALVPIFAVLATVCSWVSLAVSERRKRDLLPAFALNLLTVLFLCRALDSLGACYSYYVTG